MSASGEVSGGEEMMFGERKGSKMKSYGGRKKNPRKEEEEECRHQEEEIKKAWEALEKREEIIDLDRRSPSPESLSVGRAEKKYGGSQSGRFVSLPAPPPRLSRDNQRRLDCSPTREDDVTIAPAMTDLGKKGENPGGQSKVTSGDGKIQHLARKENSSSVPQPSVSLSAPTKEVEEALDLSLPTRERARLGLV